jgi:hypothetical protein
LFVAVTSVDERMVMSLIRIVSVISIKVIRIVSIRTRFMSAYRALGCGTGLEATTSEAVYPIHYSLLMITPNRMVMALS